MFNLKNKKRDQNLLTGCLHNVPVIMCNMSAVVKPYFIEIVNFSEKTGNDQKVLIFRFSWQSEYYDQNCIITKANYIHY